MFKFLLNSFQGIKKTPKKLTKIVISTGHFGAVDLPDYASFEG